MPPPEDGAQGSRDLHTLIRRQLDALAHRDDVNVDRLVASMHRRFGDRLAAVLLYGSYLRGRRDTLLDFYVLLTDLAGALPRLQALGNRWLPPNVYYLSLLEDEQGPPLKAKYATMTVAQFEAAMDDFHSYLWSRFTQPAGLVEARDERIAERVAAALTRAVQRFAGEVAPTLSGGDTFTSRHFWQHGLRLTYGCELRSEDPAGVESLYDHHAAHFDALLIACAADSAAAIVPQGDDGYAAVGGSPGAARTSLRWRVRRAQGKMLSVLRLVKAAATFEDPLDYLLWKIQRHSGIYIEPSDRQRRHPLIFAWPLLWRLYRRGAFR